MYSFLVIHWSFLSKLAGTVLVPDSRNVLVLCELNAFPNQGTLDMAAQFNTQHAGDTHQQGWSYTIILEGFVMSQSPFFP